MADASLEAQALIAALLEGHRAIGIVNYVTMSSFALVVWDFIITFPGEVRLMWPAPLSFPKVLFFVVRYYIFANNIFWAMYLYPMNVAPDKCLSAFHRITISSQMVVLFSEIILFFRVYAFSGKNKKLLVWLAFQFIGIYGVAKIYLLVKHMETAKFIQFPFTGLHCMPAELENKLLSAVFSLLLANIVVIMGIMMYLAFMKHKNFNSNLLRVFYRDGIFYFVLLSSFAIANIAINTAFASGGLRYLFINMEVNFHAILSTRMLLHIRLWAEKDRHRAGLGSGSTERPGVSTHTSASKLLSAIRFKTNTTVETTTSQGSVTKHDVHWS